MRRIVSVSITDMETSGTLILSTQLSNPDVTGRERSRMIALQADQARRRQAVAGILRKFACGNPALPVGTLELIADHFAAIEPMLYMIAFYDEARLVPLIERQHDTGWCAVERVRGRGGGEATAAVVRVRVIEELIFRSAPVDVIVLARAAVKDTAVARLADLPFELELEISEALFRDQVIYRAILGEHPAGDVPARRQSGLFPAAPVGRAVLLQERTPGC